MRATFSVSEDEVEKEEEEKKRPRKTRRRQTEGQATTVCEVQRTNMEIC